MPLPQHNYIFEIFFQPMWCLAANPNFHAKIRTTIKIGVSSQLATFEMNAPRTTRQFSWDGLIQYGVDG